MLEKKIVLCQFLADFIEFMFLKVSGSGEHTYFTAFLWHMLYTCFLAVVILIIKFSCINWNFDSVLKVFGEAFSRKYFASNHMAVWLFSQRFYYIRIHLNTLFLWEVQYPRKTAWVTFWAFLSQAEQNAEVEQKEPNLGHLWMI